MDKTNKSYKYFSRHATSICMHVHVPMHPFIRMRIKTYIHTYEKDENIYWLCVQVTNRAFTFRAIPWFDQCFKFVQRYVGLIWCGQNIPNFCAVAFERFKTVLGQFHFRSHQYWAVSQCIRTFFACKHCIEVSRVNSLNTFKHFNSQIS